MEIKEIKLTKSQAQITCHALSEQIDYYVKQLQTRGILTQRRKINKTYKKPYLEYLQDMLNEVEEREIIKKKIEKKYNL